VQTTHKIPGDGAAAFADYLTSTSRRGDYYLGQDGEGDRAESPEGRWHGPPATLRGLGVDPEGPVDREALVSLMGGVAPATGEPFRLVGGDGSRVAGIDLTFSARSRCRRCGQWPPRFGGRRSRRPTVGRWPARGTGSCGRWGWCAGVVMGRLSGSGQPGWWWLSFCIRRAG